MKLSSYIQKCGRGAVAHLVRESGLSRNTVEKAQRGEPITVASAKALSAATRGEVTVKALAGL